MKTQSNVFGLWFFNPVVKYVLWILFITSFEITFLNIPELLFIRCIKIAIYLCYKKKYCSTMHHEHLHVGVSNYNTSCFKTILRPLVKVIAWFEFHKVYTYFTFLFINCSKIVNLFILLVLNNLLSHTCHYLTLCCWFNPFINETFE